MLGQDVRTYLCTVSGIISYFSPKATISGIFLTQAPTGSLMPYVVVEVSEGPRELITVSKTEETASVRVTVNCGPAQMYKGANIILEVRKALENYRGDMGGSKDIVCKCSAIRDWAGTGGCYRYAVTATIKHIETRNKPVGSVG
jgi:hypothetical protein